MSSAVARPMRNSSKKLTSSTSSIPRISLLGWFPGGRGRPRRLCHQGGFAALRSKPLMSHRGHSPSDLLDAAHTLVRAPRQVDAEFLRGPEDLVVGLAHLQGHAV